MKNILLTGVKRTWLHLTQSAGIHGDGYVANAEYSRMAIDLALGRGGDQAVVRKDEDVFYYGGKLKTVGKNTRVENIKVLIFKHNEIFVFFRFAHKRVYF